MSLSVFLYPHVCKSLLQNIVCFIGLFCKRDLSFNVTIRMSVGLCHYRSVSVSLCLCDDALFFCFFVTYRSAFELALTLCVQGIIHKVRAMG